MKRIVFRSLAGQPIVINKDTQFEVGDTTLEPALGGPRTRVLRAADVIEEAAKGAANTAFDPNKRDQFAHYVSILCAFHDAGLGTSDTSEEVAQPANGHKVGPTARALLASEAEMATELPVSYRLFDWASLRAKVEHLEEVTTIRDQVAVRLENLTILQAQERQAIMADLTHFWKTSQSAIEQHRGLKRTLEPLADLMIHHNIGTEEECSFVFKKLQRNYFSGTRQK